MATTFSLTDWTTTVNLATDTGFKLLDGYNPVAATPLGDGSIPSYVTEVLPVIIFNTSADNLASLIQEFHTLQRNAAEYWVDRQATRPVWFRQKMDNETGVRQALVKSMELRFRQNPYSALPLHTEGVEATIILERHPFLEQYTEDTFSSGSLSGVSVAYDYTSAMGDIVGDVSARVQLTITDTLGTGNIRCAWIGLRSQLRHGTLANFHPIWEYEVAGATMGTDASRQPDATASPGSSPPTNTYVEVKPNPGTPTMIERHTMELSDQTANESDNFGLYLWLLRARATNGSTWHAYLEYGTESWCKSSTEIVEIVGDGNWYFYKMGVFPIPGRNLQVFTTTDLADSFDRHFTIETLAERTVGAAGNSLDLDCLCPIPVDEGFLEIISDVGSYEGVPNAPVIEFYRSPADEGQAILRSTTDIHDVPLFCDENFRLPVGDGRMIIALGYPDMLACGPADTYTVAGSVFQRWVTLRGAE